MVGTAVGSFGWLPPVGGSSMSGIEEARRGQAESGCGRERRRRHPMMAAMDWVRWGALPDNVLLSVTTRISYRAPRPHWVEPRLPPPFFYSWISGCRRHGVQAGCVLPLCPRAATPPPPPPQLRARAARSSGHSLYLRSIPVCSSLKACRSHDTAHVVRMAAAEASSLFPHPRRLPSPPPLPPQLTAIPTAALVR